MAETIKYRADGVPQVDHLTSQAHLVKILGLADAATFMNVIDVPAIDLYLAMPFELLEKIVEIKFKKGEEPSAPASVVYITRGGDMTALRRKYGEELTIASDEDNACDDQDAR